MKYQIIVVLILVSVGMLVWAALSDREVSSNAELIILDPYVVVPSVEPIDTNVLQVDKL
jgi:flagellar basal body-associated protein FliL